MLYRLIDPVEVFKELRKEEDCLTIEECAKKIGVDPGALGRAVTGQRIAPKTVRAIAKAVKKSRLAIAQQA